MTAAAPDGPAALAAAIGARAGGRGRFITAIAGPPGAGKSTLAAGVVAALGPGARVVPMDGFHYDNAVLARRGLLPRKGAPETFDLDGFAVLLRRLRAGGTAAIPVFDRAADLSRAAADVVAAEDRLLVVEGNYLLLDEPGWRDLAPLFDLTVAIAVPEAELERRLIRRWRDHGLDAAAAAARTQANDLPNAQRVVAGSRAADLVLSQ